MKAKEYYQEYLKDDSDIMMRVSKIAHDMLYEMQDMITTRNPRRQSAFISIFKEQNSKWKVFTGMIDGKILTDPESFLIDYMKVINKKLYDSWKTIGAFN